MSALEIKIDILTALTKQANANVLQNTAAIEALTEATKISANSMESMAEAFRELTERITAEPEDGESLGQLLQNIHRAVLMVLERLPAKK